MKSVTTASFSTGQQPDFHKPNVHFVFVMPVRLLLKSKSMSSPVLKSIGDVHSTEVDWQLSCQWPGQGPVIPERPLCYRTKDIKVARLGFVRLYHPTCFNVRVRSSYFALNNLFKKVSLIYIGDTMATQC